MDVFLDASQDRSSTLRASTIYLMFCVIFMNNKLINQSVSVKEISDYNIVILGTFRSGTHHLSGIIASNGFDFVGELFNRQDYLMSIKDSIKTKEDISLYLKNILSEKKVAILHRRWFINVFYKFLESNESDVNFILDVFPKNVKYIHIKRNNIAEIAVSNYLAHKVSRFAAYSEEDFLNQNNESKNVEYNYFEIMKYAIEHVYGIWPKEFLRICCAEIDYFDLCKNTKREIIKIDNKFNIFQQNKYIKQEYVNKEKFVERFFNDFVNKFGFEPTNSNIDEIKKICDGIV